ncbi:AraC family transcriptional regulator [Mucilaginibacter sp. FT3.2]|uniref:AraC family transcriptional regulator n=1 Tax=Mucilaginibacter sp. FT3.2 TaxID=2723090 RepID=UPI00161E304E|nr:helix-turn-helix domain-containing protein [Mucilaginibacter sp. FT3.2]MBB6230390.1 AraC-like DNA-binding protein [Mucilaginibacter sp. FT3.2]
MKPQLLKVPYGPDHSFGVRKEMSPNINNRWHYHPEIELIHFHNGFGTQFIGDHISQFEPGDIVLVGSNLPHFWKYDEANFELPADTNPYSTVIHFFENFMGERFLHLPETRHVKMLLEKAKRGIVLRGSDSKNIGNLIEKIHNSEGINKIIALIECISEFANCKNITPLSSLGFKYDFPESENKRINAIYNHSLNNFNKKIKLSDVAEIAGMTPNSFCRYFKHYTGKTYSDFVMDIRVGYACKLLIANKTNIKQICFESGFNNFSCFHQYFKKITGKTPQAYQLEYK